MILAPTPSFYMLEATEEAARIIASTLSSDVQNDIKSVLIVSREFSNDIEPTNELRESTSTIRLALAEEPTETLTFNPLFVPSSQEALDEALDSEIKGDHFRFVGMNGNPFAVAILELTSRETPILTGTVSYQQFDLPGYEDLMKERSRPLN